MKNSTFTVNDEHESYRGSLRYDGSTDDPRLIPSSANSKRNQIGTSLNQRNHINRDDDVSKSRNDCRSDAAEEEIDFTELPVIAYKNEIMECIVQNKIIICIGETGR